MYERDGDAPSHGVKIAYGALCCHCGSRERAIGRSGEAAVQLQYKYGPDHTWTEEEADAEVQQGFRVEPCRYRY